MREREREREQIQKKRVWWLLDVAKISSFIKNEFQYHDIPHPFCLVPEKFEKVLEKRQLQLIILTTSDCLPENYSGSEIWTGNNCLPPIMKLKSKQS